MERDRRDWLQSEARAVISPPRPGPRWCVATVDCSPWVRWGVALVPAPRGAWVQVFTMTSGGPLTPSCSISRIWHQGS